MKKNTNNTFCCESLDFFIKEKEYPILYSKAYRSFDMRVLDGGSSVIVMKYCPWCGEKFPKELTDTFFSELSKCLNKDAGLDDIDDAPKEFQTDEWWKKRGL